MPLKGIGFADRDAIPWGILDFFASDERCAERPARQALIG
jgi:hypothetical protein